MNTENKKPSEENSIDERLWNYIDGVASAEERTMISQLLQSNLEWKRKYQEFLEVHELLNASELEEPSMRFSRNVMEEIAKFHIAPATKSYINKKIIYGLGAFFITMIVGFLIFGFGQINWAAEGDTKLPVDFSKVNLSRVDFSQFFSNTYVNIFMMINVVLGLMLLDRYLSKKKNEKRAGIS